MRSSAYKRLSILNSTVHAGGRRGAAIAAAAITALLAPVAAPAQTPPALVKDIRPGATSSTPSRFSTVYGRLFFLANMPGPDGTSLGNELYMSDGTAAGTRPLLDSVPGPQSGEARALGAGSRYVIAGTTADPTPGVARPGNIFRVNLETGEVSPIARDFGNYVTAQLGRRLFIMNGAQTRMLAVNLDDNAQTEWKLAEGTPVVRSPGLVVASGRVYFVSEASAIPGSADKGRELYSTDGTAAGTRLEADLRAGTADSNPGRFYLWNQKLLFAADFGGTVGTELVALDLTKNTSDSTRFTQINLAADDNVSSDPTVVSSTTTYALVLASTVGSGAEPWRTDGTVAGSFRLRDIYDGSTGSTPRDFTVIGNNIFFTAVSQGAGRELWRTDGSNNANGTVLMGDLADGSKSSSPHDFLLFKGGLLFSAVNTANVVGVYRVVAGANNITPVFRPFESSPEIFVYPLGVVGTRGARALYAASRDSSDPFGPLALWSTDGTLVGTVNLTQAMGVSDPGLQSIFYWGRTPIFQLSSSEEGAELWTSDGTAANTTLLANLNPGSASSFPASFYDFDGSVYFSANYTADGANSGTELWRFTRDFLAVYPTANAESAADSLLKRRSPRVSDDRNADGVVEISDLIRTLQ